MYANIKSVTCYHADILYEPGSKKEKDKDGKKKVERKRNKSDGGSVARWQMTQNRSDFAADRLSGSPLGLCDGPLSSAFFMAKRFHIKRISGR